MNEQMESGEFSEFVSFLKPAVRSFTPSHSHSAVESCACWTALTDRKWHTVKHTVPEILMNNTMHSCISQFVWHYKPTIITDNKDNFGIWEQCHIKVLFLKAKLQQIEHLKTYYPDIWNSLVFAGHYITGISKILKHIVFFSVKLYSVTFAPANVHVNLFKW